MTTKCCPVGKIEVAARLGVQERTAHMWQFRGLLPDPEFTVNGLPAWSWLTVLRWAGDGGRLGTDELRDEYRRTFKREPAPQRTAGRPPKPPVKTTTRTKKVR